MSLLSETRSFARALIYGPPSSRMWGSGFIDAVKLSTLDDETARLFGRSVTAATRTYRLPSVDEAMGTPAIYRAVTLIGSTTGMLRMQAYRNGALMDQPPGLIVRPDPDQTPFQFYSETAANHAKYGEFVWWIASRDSDGLAAALVNVPLLELSVMENPEDRRRPRYQWGTLSGTRWSPVNPDGIFVHMKMPGVESLALRGRGPLQFNRAAASISVEAQAWAAQFYADGGDPSVLIKKAGYLSPELDEDGLSEADRLRAQWVGRPHNVPRVIDDYIESVDYKQPNTNAAQMLDARQHQNGDAARMFGVPGSLIEYQQPGSSLTYQNLEGEFTKLVKVCLRPNYLEPIEHAMTDLLTRSTVASFNLFDYTKADIKTRYEVYQLAIQSGIFGPDYAQRQEGIAPGDVETAPVPFREPSAMPAAIPRIASTAMRDIRCPTCQRLVVRAAGAVEGWCRHCKATVAA